MEAVTVSGFSGVMGSVLAKLAALLAEDFKLAKGAKNDIISLTDEMGTINTALVVLCKMEEPIDAPHRDLRNKLRELAYDMEDILDESRHRLGSKDGLLGELKTVRARYKIATLIGTLKARVAALGDRGKLMLQLPEHRPPPVCVDPRIKALYTDATGLQGIGGPKEKLVELLQDGTPQLKVVSIVGSGGIGKTTLAKQVYTAIRGKYDLIAFVSVSRSPDFTKISSDILEDFGLPHSVTRQDDVNRIIIRLQAFLKDKRYLIVIDDIWEIKTWKILKCFLIDKKRGSRVITTTRAEDTAKECCSSSQDCVYRINPLNDVDSRILFYRTIFHSEDAFPEQLKCISNEILKKCGGLPLAILTIGSILANQQGVRSMEIWQKIMHSFRFQLETRSHELEWMRHVFDLGYNDLSLDLKTCMLYLGIFPEDDKILKADLLRRWIAEGFITGDCEEVIAESYINELINRNMIQIAEFDDCGDVFSVRVHDLLLEYIIMKSREENFIININDDKHSTNGSFKVRRLSVQIRNSEDLFVSATSGGFFCFFGSLLQYFYTNKPQPQQTNNRKQAGPESCAVLKNMALTQARSFNLWGPAQWLSSLKKFRLLRVLHLDIFGSSWDIQYDMSSVSSLFQLRYLRIRGILHRELLGIKLCNLEQLRTLDVFGEQGYFTLDARLLPSTLQHLNGVHQLKGGIGQLRDLRTLCGFEIDLRDVGRMKELGELTSLRELEFYRGVYGREDTCDVLLSSLCRLCNLRSLIIGGSLDTDFLTGWSPPPRHLRRLHLLKCPFSTVPADLLAHLGSLRSLEIWVLSLPSDGADVLARLTSLVHLTLHVNSAPQEDIVFIRRAAFPNLRELSFRCEAPCLAFEQGTMPRLRSLVIECHARGTRHTDRVLDGIEHLGSLDELEVRVFEREDFLSRYFSSGSIEVEETGIEKKWDGRSLEAALKEVISKHPGSLRVVIVQA